MLYKFLNDTPILFLVKRYLHHNRGIRTPRQEQSRSNADNMQYIFINGLVGFIAKWQPKPLTYENNYNVRENGKFVKTR